jgi:hypothetical protein
VRRREPPPENKPEIQTPQHEPPFIFSPEFKSEPKISKISTKMPIEILLVFRDFNSQKKHLQMKSLFFFPFCFGSDLLLRVVCDGFMVESGR